LLFQSLVFVQCSYAILMVRQAMSIKDVAAQSASWQALKLDDEPEKKCENSEGEVCQDPSSQCTTPYLPYTDPTLIRCRQLKYR